MTFKRLTLAIIWTIAILAPIIGTAHYVLFPQLSHSLFIQHSAFNEFGPNLFASPATSNQTIDSLKVSVETAKNRMWEMWGSYDEAFSMIYCRTLEEYTKYGTEYASSPGLTHVSPLGTYVIINGSQGIDTDVISHEICHTQLMANMGWLAREFEIPTWFDEGLALLVDYRFSNVDSLLQEKLQSGLSPRLLNDISEPSTFYSGGNEAMHLAYLTAGNEVFQWYKMVGPKGLKMLVERLEDGETFDEAYEMVKSINDTTKE